MLCCPLLYTRYSESRQPSASTLLGFEKTLAPSTLTMTSRDDLAESLSAGGSPPSLRVHIVPRALAGMVTGQHQKMLLARSRETVCGCLDVVYGQKGAEGQDHHQELQHKIAWCLHHCGVRLQLMTLIGSTEGLRTALPNGPVDVLGFQQRRLANAQRRGQDAARAGAADDVEHLVDWPPCALLKLPRSRVRSSQVGEAQPEARAGAPKSAHVLCDKAHIICAFTQKRRVASATCLLVRMELAVLTCWAGWLDMHTTIGRSHESPGE